MESLVITNKGQELITKLIAGTDTATFTKIVASDHDYTASVLEDLETLADIKQEALVSSVVVTDTSLVEVTARIDNSGLTDGYYVKTLGLYATDTDGNEILYGVSIAAENPDWMPAFGGRTVTGISYRFNVKVDNSESVNIVIDPAAVPTMEQISEMQETINTIQQKDTTQDGQIKSLEELMGDTSLAGIDDETVTGIIKSFYGFMKHIEDNAAAHNGIYVNEDITDMWNDGTFSKNVQNGTFKDIFPGMYITKSFTASGLETGVTEDFVVGDLDYHMHHGDTETTAHHALMLMKNGSSVTHKMNSSNVTTGGYVGSAMWTSIIPKYAAGIQSAFGSSHVLSHRELLTNAISTSGTSMAGAGFTGYSSGWAWYDVIFNIMNNAMRFGVTATSSSFYDTGDCTKQLALFQLDSASKIAHLGKGGARHWDWLRDVASATHFAICGADGRSDCYTASGTVALRGYFLLR